MATRHPRGKGWQFKDLTGQTFGWLTVLRRGPDHFSRCGKRHTRWECVCRCGKSLCPLGSGIKQGTTVSCGCKKPGRAQESVADRFWAQVDTGDGCWTWKTEATGDHQYPMIGLGTPKGEQRQEMASHIAWMMAHGPIPDGLFVLHRCDNRRCVRPHHLFLGTQADNMADMVSKGRSAVRKGKPRSILSWHSADAIRLGHAAGERIKDLAREFGVTNGTIHNVLTGKSWKPKISPPLQKPPVTV